ncbi:MFS transporter [Ammoniphilus sp. CFH 90114]|uniref:MFS transporter n=1 Tax=Ammoniphilus sp. CFH 90114 TaxID=2493665 RepID=UPI00100F1341|nr:MFS transporter [Ammoniphilus sp. CFH 90114]RXT05695.1 MFS transporter [Ammoniphilus sp. CFH 90114]
MIEQGTKDYWRATLALSLGSFLVFAMVYLTQPLLPLFTEQFGVSASQASYSLSIVTLFISIALLFYGPISDSLGRKVIMVWTMLGAIVVTLAIPFMTSFESILVLRAIQGAFLAGLPSLAMAYMAEEFSPAALSLAIGLYISANSLGGLSGRLISGAAADLWGWEASFWVIGLLGLSFFFLFVWMLPASKQFKKVPFDVRQALGGLTRHLRNPVLSVAFLVGGLNFFVFLGSFNYITFLLSAAPYRLSPTLLGLLFVTYLAGTVSSTLSGKMAQQWGKTVCLLVGIGLFALGIIFTLHHSLVVIFIGLLIQCFGFFFAHSASASWVNSHAEFARASASSLYLVSYYLGGSLGSSFLGVFWEAWHWPGVVGGSLLVLCVTFGCSLWLNRAERVQEASRFVSCPK